MNARGRHSSHLLYRQVKRTGNFHSPSFLGVLCRFVSSCGAVGGAFCAHLLLVNGFRCERHLRDNVLLLGIAGEGIVLRGDLHAVKGLDVAIIVLDVQAVGLHGRAVDMIILAAIMSVKHKAVFGIVRELCRTEMLESPAAGHGVNVNLVFKAVCAVFNLLGDLSALPFKPIGNVREFGFALVCLQRTVLHERPALAAFGAEDLCALGIHLGFCHAVGALIKDLVHTLRAVGLGDENAVFLLVAVIVVGECLADDLRDLLGGKLFDLLNGEDLRHRGVKRNLSRLAEVPEGRMQMVTAVQDRNDGRFVHLDEHTDGIGDIRIDTAGGITRFGIHTEDITALQNLADGFHKVEIRSEFSCTDGADPLHEPRTAIITVDVHHVVHAVRIGGERGKLKVDEIHMVGKDHVRRLQAFHIDLFDLVFLADEHDLGEKPDEPCQIDRLADGVLCGLVASFVFIIYVDIHGMPMPFPWIFPSIILYIILRFLPKINRKNELCSQFVVYL